MTDTVLAHRPAVDYIVERTGGEIVRDSLRIYREHFGVLVAIYAAPMLPVMALSAYAVGSASPWATRAAEILPWAVELFPVGAVTVAVADICLGNRPSLPSAYRIMLANFWRYVVTYLLFMLAFAVGLVLLVIPGLIVGVWFMFSCQVCVIERRGPVASLRRSRRLVRGSFWRCAGIWLALLCIVLLGAISLMVVFQLVATYAVGDWYVETWTVLDDVVNSAITLCAVPFMLTGLVLLYYDLRVRKENFDSASLMDELMH
jgi:hypothetical protein